MQETLTIVDTGRKIVSFREYFIAIYCSENITHATEVVIKTQIKNF